MAAGSIALFLLGSMPFMSVALGRDAAGRRYPATLHTLIHTFSLEILVPHIVVTPPEFDVQIPAIDVKLWMSSRI